MSSKIDQHSSQTSRKYYQVDNLQDIFKLTKACKIMSKKNANLLAYVEDIEFTEFSIQHYMKSEMFSNQNLGEKKKGKKNKIYFGNSFLPVYPERNHMWLCSSYCTWLLAINF